MPEPRPITPDDFDLGRVGKVIAVRQEGDTVEIVIDCPDGACDAELREVATRNIDAIAKSIYGQHVWVMGDHPIERMGEA